MLSPPVTSVVFDIGGVLLDWDPRHLYRRLIPDEATRERFLAEVCTPAWNALLDAGRPMAEACDELAHQHPDQAEWIRAWVRQDEMVAGEVPGTSAVVHRLAAHDVPLYLLTNMPTDVFEARRARFEVLRVFAGAVVSGDEGILKPDRRIFERLVARFDLDPGTTLFIDDQPANVDGARAAGLLAHHFTNVATLASALEAHGLA